MDHAQRQQLKERRYHALRRLRVLELHQARDGMEHTRPLITEIDDLRATISDIDQWLCLDVITSGADSATTGGDLTSPGVLELSAVDLRPNEYDQTCFVDFQVANRGGSDVVITRVQFEAVEVVEVYTRAAVPRSPVYDVDISDINHVGDQSHVNVSQIVRPGKLEHVGMTLIAKHLGLGCCRGWTLRPTLVTNIGPVRGTPFEVWLPEPWDTHLDAYR